MRSSNYNLFYKDTQTNRPGQMSRCSGNCNYQIQRCNENNTKCKLINNRKSLITSDKSASTIFNGSYDPEDGPAGTWNQSSDRSKKHIQSVVIPSHGNSVKRSTTRIRPNAIAPGGEGVDIKHNNYYRYLGKRKGQLLCNNCGK
jgi:hypothetical protein